MQLGVGSFAYAQTYEAATCLYSPDYLEEVFSETASRLHALLREVEEAPRALLLGEGPGDPIG